MRDILFYRTADNRCPVEEFLDGLNAKQGQKVTWVLRLIEDLPNVPTTYLKKLVNTEDIWEIRIKTGNDSFRLLGFFHGPRLVVLDYAFQKKTRKTPRQAIKIAEQRKRDYCSRRKDNE